MKTIDVCLSPALLKHNYYLNGIVVVIDVLRASSAICAAFDAGIGEIFPVTSLNKAMILSKKGALVAAERNGIKPEFADFGNSPHDFRNESFNGEKLVYSTTNGTRTLMMVRQMPGVIIGSFNNLGRVTEHLMASTDDILLLCSGWLESVSIEDTLCAGAIAEKLIFRGGFWMKSDSSFMAMELWKAHKHNLRETVFNSEHGNRLRKLGLEADIEYCLTPDVSGALPVWNGHSLINHKNNK